MPIIPEGATQFQIAKANHLYAVILADIDTIGKVKTGLHCMVLEAVNHMNLAALEDKDMGYANITFINMINHLETTYGAITRKHLEGNCKKFKTM